MRHVASGSIWFDGVDITKVPAHERVDMGICQAPEGRGIFPGMTVMENLEMGGYAPRIARAPPRSVTSIGSSASSPA